MMVFYFAQDSLTIPDHVTVSWPLATWFAVGGMFVMTMLGIAAMLQKQKRLETRMMRHGRALTTIARHLPKPVGGKILAQMLGTNGDTGHDESEDEEG